MAAAQNPNVYLEAVEEAENQGAEPEKVGHPIVAGLPVGEYPLGYWRVAGSAVLSHSITNEKLALGGVFSATQDFSLFHDTLCLASMIAQTWLIMKIATSHKPLFLGSLLSAFTQCTFVFFQC